MHGSCDQGCARAGIGAEAVGRKEINAVAGLGLSVAIFGVALETS